MRAGEQTVAGAVDDDPPGVPVEAVEFDVGGANAAARLDADTEPVGADSCDAHAVADAAQLEVQWSAALVLYLRASAERRRQQPLPLDAFLLLVGLDGGGGQRDGGVPVRDESAFAADAVDPAGVRAGVDHLGLVEQVEHEALVRRAALDDHGGLCQRPTQPAERLVAVAAVGDDLRDHRVEVGGDDVALADTGVHADARPGGQVQPRDAAGGGREVAVGVLGVESGLDGVPALHRRLAFEPAAGCHPQLRLDQVESGGGLGDRVLDLQAGVDLQEREQFVVWTVEELDGRRAPVTDRDGQPFGRRLEFGCLRGVEHRRRRLLDDLLVASLHRAVADAERPCGALAVGDHLDLDVPGAGDQAFQEHHAAAERPRGLLAGAFVGVGEFGLVRDHADAAPAAARGRLQHQRVADLARRRQGGVQGLDRAAAPRRDRYADLLGDQLRTDLVAELAHGFSARSDEGDSDPCAQLRERRIFRDEAPADPRGVGPGLHQRALQYLQVEIRARGRGTEIVGGVGFADEGGRAVDIGVQGDGLDPCPGLRGDVPYGVDEPHSGFTTVDDGDTTEHPTEPFCRPTGYAPRHSGPGSVHPSVYRTAVPCRGQPTLGVSICGKRSKARRGGCGARGGPGRARGVRAGGWSPPATPRRC